MRLGLILVKARIDGARSFFFTGVMLLVFVQVYARITLVKARSVVSHVMHSEISYAALSLLTIYGDMQCRYAMQ